jgi:hypothetical protein
MARRGFRTSGLFRRLREGGAVYPLMSRPDGSRERLGPQDGGEKKSPGTERPSTALRPLAAQSRFRRFGAYIDDQTNADDGETWCRARPA